MPMSSKEDPQALYGVAYLNKVAKMNKQFAQERQRLRAQLQKSAIENEKRKRKKSQMSQAELEANGPEVIHVGDMQSAKENMSKRS